MSAPILISHHPQRTISAPKEVKPKFFEYRITEGNRTVPFVFAIWDLNRHPAHCVSLLEKRLEKAAR